MLELAVVNTAETYVFIYPLKTSGDRAKNDQLRVLGKFREQLKVAITLDSASNLIFCNSKIEAVIADSGYSHEMRRLVCFLFLKQGT
jgi:hypothetical protein